MDRMIVEEQRPKAFVIEEAQMTVTYVDASVAGSGKYQVTVVRDDLTGQVFVISDKDDFDVKVIK